MNFKNMNLKKSTYFKYLKLNILWFLFQNLRQKVLTWF